MVWNIFDVDFRGAHPAEQSFGLIVGNLHIRTPGLGQTPSTQARRRIVTSCLNFIADQGTHYGDQPVARVLVGDCNLSTQDAQAATQDPKKP